MTRKKANPDNKELKLLQEQVKQLRLQNEISQHQLQIKLQESLSYSPPYDLINPFSQMFDGQQMIFPLFPSRWDYRLFNSGIWVSEAQLDLIRMYARFLYDTNLQAKGAVKAFKNYVLHTGFDYQIQPKEGRRVSEALLELTQRTLDDFLNKNTWFLREQDLFIRTKRDGEAYPRIFPQDDGISEIRMVEPEQIRPPDRSPEWMFGVKVDVDDKEKVLGYWIAYDGDVTHGELASPEEMHQIKLNVDLIIRRGLSDFFCTQEMLQNSQKLLRASVMGESVRQAIAYVREHAQASQQTITSLQTLNTDYLTPLPTAQGVPRLEPVHQVVPGEVHDVPEGLTYKGSPIGSAENAAKILAAAYQSLAAYWQAPQWVISGDTGNTNFAQSLTAESPFVRECESQQKFYGHHFKVILLKVLAIAETQGIIPEGTLEKIDINVVVPPVTVRDPHKDTERHALLNEAKILSKETWAKKEDLEFEHEQENIKEEIAKGISQADVGPKGKDESTSSSAEYKRLTGDPYKEKD